MISNRKKILAGVRIATTYDLDYKEMNAITKSIETKDLYLFALELSEQVQERFGIRVRPGKSRGEHQKEDWQKYCPRSNYV